MGRKKQSKKQMEINENRLLETHYVRGGNYSKKLGPKEFIAIQMKNKLKLTELRKCMRIN